MKKTKAAKPSREQFAEAVKQILNVSFAGAILESVAEFLAAGRGGSPLKAVVVDAEKRLQQQAWRKQITEML